MKKFLFLLLAVTTGTAAAQTLVYSGGQKKPAVPKTFDNELGVRYGAQLYVGDGRGPELQAFSIDYARYNFYNIGFRTGLNVFVDEDAENYFSVPLQFTWRTGRIASSWRRESRERSVQNNYYNGSYADPYGAYSGGGADVGSTFLNVLLAILPSGFEVHAGFTPGLMCGPFTTEGYSTTDPSWRPYTVRQRFSCTFDAGARLIIPIWRFNLFGDFTYHCYLTDNFRAGEFRPSRSYMGLGVGLSFNF
jgi:hypothetical protein|uniref:hypothetical protein n=2 Tax=Alistipes shahii TaxID=328814 RepID=UPI003AB5030A